MKKLNQFITEKLKLSKNKIIYNYFPQTIDELKKLVDKLIKERGNNANLNDIDTSNIDNMRNLFIEHHDFYGDVSEWDVSNVEDMNGTFAGCVYFNCDLSNWNVSNVKNMGGMFYECKNFNQDISEWDVSNVWNMINMFFRCEKFNQNLDKWNVDKCHYYDRKNIFYQCPLKNNPPIWYKE